MLQQVAFTSRRIQCLRVVFILGIISCTRFHWNWELSTEAGVPPLTHEVLRGGCAYFCTPVVFQLILWQAAQQYIGVSLDIALLALFEMKRVQMLVSYDPLEN